METYKVVDNELKNLDSDLLNKLSNEDWDILQIIHYRSEFNGSRVKIILRK